MSCRCRRTGKALPSSWQPRPPLQSIPGWRNGTVRAFCWCWTRPSAPRVRRGERPHAMAPQSLLLPTRAATASPSPVPPRGRLLSNKAHDLALRHCPHAGSGFSPPIEVIVLRYPYSVAPSALHRWPTANWQHRKSLAADPFSLSRSAPLTPPRNPYRRSRGARRHTRTLSCSFSCSYRLAASAQSKVLPPGPCSRKPPPPVIDNMTRPGPEPTSSLTIYHLGGCAECDALSLVEMSSAGDYWH